MVLRIVIDVVRRKWKVITWVALTLFFYSKTLRSMWPSLDPLGFMLVGAGYLTVWPGLFLGTRELSQLPVSRRDWWLARWWLSTVGASVVAASATLLAQWAVQGQFPGAQDIATRGATAFVYTGSVVALHTTSLGRTFDKPATVTSFLVGTPLVMGLIGAPLLYSRFLPHRIADINLAAGTVLVLASALTIRGYFNSPAIAPRLGRGRARRESTTAGRTVAKQSHSVPGRLTGLGLALWDEWRWQFLTFALVIVLVTAAWTIWLPFRHVPTFVDFLHEVDALPFSTARAHVTEQATWVLLFMLTNFRQPWLLASARRLRSLPISVNRLSCLPIGLALLSATALWVVLLALHLIVLRSAPASPRSDLFMAFAGLTTMSHAIRLVSPNRGVSTSVLPLAPAAALFMTVGIAVDSWQTWRPEIVQPAMFSAGLLMMVISFVASRYSLTRTARMYRSRPLVVRLG